MTKDQQLLNIFLRERLKDYICAPLKFTAAQIEALAEYTSACNLDDLAHAQVTMGTITPSQCAPFCMAKALACKGVYEAFGLPPPNMEHS